MKFLARWFVSAASIYIIARLLTGIQVSGFEATLIAAAVLGIVNMIIRPILVILTLPITIVSLGLFTFVINALTLKLTAFLVPGLTVNGLFSALLGSILISVVNMLLGNLLGVRD